MSNWASLLKLMFVQFSVNDMGDIKQFISSSSVQLSSLSPQVCNGNLVQTWKKTTIWICRCRSKQKGRQVGCFFNMNRLGFLFSVLLLLDPPSFCLQSVLWIETFSAGCWKPKMFLSFRLMWGLRNRLPLKDTKSVVTWLSQTWIRVV